jgi:hypothetical protein
LSIEPQAGGGLVTKVAKNDLSLFVAYHSVPVTGYPVRHSPVAHSGRLLHQGRIPLKEIRSKKETKLGRRIVCGKAEL